MEYKADWESLSKHKASPEWFADAKLGIYFHWGIYSVPAYGDEWYPFRLYQTKETDIQKHHKETYGSIESFGYHEFARMFKAEYFNASEWVQLFQDAGAKFVGPVAEHHDGYSMWESNVTPWNSMDIGPHRDILGEIKKEVEKRDMKLIATFHHARQLQRNNPTNFTGRNRASHYRNIPGTATASNDSLLALLYGNLPEEDWNERVWYGKLKEVIDNYQPDIIWFDSWLDQIPEKYRKKFCAYYLNQAEKWGKEVVIVRKQQDLPLSFTVDDLEKSRKNKKEDHIWMTDETISKGSWCYTNNLKIKRAQDLIHVLADIVSKNGVLLLNVSPKADGTIPFDQQEVLREMGKWLKKYGEAIYKTHPWYTYGEGPTKEPVGHYDNRKKFLKIKYSEKDIRYTTNGNTIYATLLGKATPERVVHLKSFDRSHKDNFKQIKDIKLVGSSSKVKWRLKKEGLYITLPNDIPNQMASVLQIDVKEI
ncbi:alpha-L-fucosidase [Halosquirtibacter xylanolyticus]|nr:alpha-L-fucosidase [Prolixibacteraceae bacterium]